MTCLAVAAVVIGVALYFTGGLLVAVGDQGRSRYVIMASLALFWGGLPAAIAILIT